jgi:hypothetical protein
MPFLNQLLAHPVSTCTISTTYPAASPAIGAFVMAYSTNNPRQEPLHCNDHEALRRSKLSCLQPQKLSCSKLHRKLVDSSATASDRMGLHADRGASHWHQDFEHAKTFTTGTHVMNMQKFAAIVEREMKTKKNIRTFRKQNTVRTQCVKDQDITMSAS